MFSCLQMPFLQALGYAIANSIWQLFLLWLIVMLVNRFVKTSSHTRYVTALSAQVAGFVWFLTTLQFYYRHCRAASLQAEQLLDNHAGVYAQSLVTDNNNLLSVLIKGEETLPYLSVAYLLLLSLLVVKWIRNFRYTKQLSSIGLEEMNGQWQRFVNEMADRLDIMQEVKVYLSSLAKSPLTIGYIKPVILLPLASINHLSPEQLEAVLLHELAHIKRADYIINMLVSIIEIILFFNPFTRLLGKTIQTERENCCDDWVLQYQYNPGMYAEALLRIASLQHQPGFQMNAASQQKGDLLQRVKRMVQPVEKRFSYKHQVVALLLITGLLFSITWLQPGENDYHHAIAKNDNKINQTIVVTPLIAQVDNPFFNGASLFSSSLQEDVNKSLAQLDKMRVDSLAGTSLRQAQVALGKVAPKMFATVSSGNWQKIASDAAKDAGNSLQTLDWSDLQQDFPQLADSSAVMASINAAMAQADKLNEVKASLATAKQSLEKLQQKNNPAFSFSFDGNYLKQLSVNALASLQNLNIRALQDSALNTVKKADEMIQQQRKDREEWKKQRQQWMKDVQKTYKKIAASMKPSLPPPPPLPPAISEQAEDDNCVNEESPTAVVADAIPSPDSYSWSLSEPVYRNANIRADKLVKTIHIISNSDSNAINIVIQIRQ